MAAKKKLYRVNSNEHFNLMSMHDKVMCQVYEARESGTFDELFAAETAKNEIEDLIDKAPCVGALVDWKTLSRIREIAIARETMRDQICACAQS